MADSITLAELHQSHVSDRHTLYRLLFTLRRDPAESLLVMSVWAWIDGLGYDVTLSSALPGEADSVLDALADEAVLCLNCLQSKIPSGGGRLPLTSRIAHAPDLNLTCFTRNKYTAIYSIKSVFKNVCPWIFSDVVLHALGNRAHQFRSPFGAVVISCPRHATFGSAELVTRPLSCQIPLSGIWGWRFRHQAPKDERTIFLTFSQGFPVVEREVLQLFASKFGYECVESLKMGIRDPYTQTLFAKMVVGSLAYMDRILNGHYLTKFQINGKHIWARKFERR
ncbi:hypothetical protein V2J09_002077 [Rumex salicifolius]